MKLYIKQKVFSWKDKFNITDAEQNPVYYCEGKFFSVGKKFYVQNKEGDELAYIHQKVLSWLPKFFISKRGEDVATVRQKFTFVKQQFEVPEYDWHISGDFWAHNYSIDKGSQPVATITKRWLSWGDTYEIDIYNDKDVIDVICTVIIIDAVNAMHSNKGSTVHTSA